MALSKIVTTGGGGVTSCLGLRLNGAVRFFEENKKFPDEIDSSQQFYFYRDEENQDISKLIFGEYAPDNNLYTSFETGWQFAIYDQIKLKELSALASNICPMSSLVGNKSYEFQNRLDGRTAVLYRGNDKCLDIPRSHYQGFVQMALDSESEKFIVQTDEDDFYDFFKERFPNTICFEELPRIKKDPDAYVMPEVGKRAEFCINFLAALRAIAQAPKLILNTGNTGLWTMFFRGHSENVWQMNGANQQWRKLNKI